MRLAVRAALALAVSVSWCLGRAAEAEEKGVTEELLEILRERGDISESKYEELKERARKEKEAAEVGSRPEDFRTYWKDGLRFERNDGYHKLKLGGRVYFDAAAIGMDDGLENYLTSVGSKTGTGHGSEFRTARLFVSGTLYERLLFKAQYDFAGGDTDFKDVYMGLTELPAVGTVLIGHFKEPFSLEELTGSRYITFMERSLANVFSPSRNSGIMVQNTLADARMTWALGVFNGESDDFGNSFSNKTKADLTARLTGLAWYADSGKELLHLGIGYSHQFRGSSFQLRYRQRPEVHLAERLVDTGFPLNPMGMPTTILNADGIDLANGELALVQGPFSVQAEVTSAYADAKNFSNKHFWGAYGQASWFVTGEHRPYDRKVGAFGRVTPLRPFNPSQGDWGAFELATRYSFLDLDDGAVDGGTIHNVTLGVNWHLFSNARIMANGIASRVYGEGDFLAYQMRFQIDF